MNRGRPKHDDILTPREWEVLDLIEAGLTNEEIADRLGISFGTAKYHVAEILSKLGVERREDAPVVARRTRTVAPVVAPFALLRERFVLPAVAVAVVAALLLLSVAVFTDLLRTGASSPSDDDLSRAAADFQGGNTDTQPGSLFSSAAPVESYYFEARVESDDEGVLKSIRAWHQKPDQWRFEFVDFSSGIPAKGSVQTSDGETVWFYEADTNTYSRQSVDAYFKDMPAQFRDAPLFLPTSLLIGPLPTNDPATFLRDFTSDWNLEDQGEGPDIAGRPTNFYRYSIPGSGEVSLWLDREYPLVLRFETENPDAPQSHLSIEITDAVLNQPVDASHFGFEPPASAVEVPPQGTTLDRSSGQSGRLGGQFDAPDGFFNPVYLPEGYSITRSESGTSSVSSTVAQYLVHLEDGTAYLDIEQRYRAGGLDPSQQEGDPVAVGDTMGYQRTEGTDLILVWSQSDIVITLRSNQLHLDELLRVAASMH